MSADNQPDDEDTGAGIVPVWMVRDTRISGPAKLVYLVLSTRTSGELTDERLLMAEAGLNSRGYGDAVSELMRIGVLSYFAGKPAVTWTLSLHLPEDADA